MPFLQSWESSRCNLFLQMFSTETNESFILIFLSFIEDKVSRKSWGIIYSGKWFYIILSGTKIANVRFRCKQILNSLFPFLFFYLLQIKIYVVKKCSKNVSFLQAQRCPGGCDCRSRRQMDEHSTRVELPSHQPCLGSRTSPAQPELFSSCSQRSQGHHGALGDPSRAPAPFAAWEIRKFLHQKCLFLMKFKFLQNNFCSVWGKNK